MISPANSDRPAHAPRRHPWLLLALSVAYAIWLGYLLYVAVA